MKAPKRTIPEQIHAVYVWVMMKAILTVCFVAMCFMVTFIVLEVLRECGVNVPKVIWSESPSDPYDYLYE